MKFIPITFNGKEIEIAETPTTFADYDAFCEATGREKPDDCNWGRDDQPVINVSYHDALAYCEWLSSKDPNHTYRLPTSEEWEFAARGGSQGAYCFGDDESLLPDYAWYYDNSDGRTHPVKQKKPNNFGLYDVHGNVWEWTSTEWKDD